jgi:hypothetical protein
MSLLGDESVTQVMCVQLPLLGFPALTAHIPLTGQLGKKLKDTGQKLFVHISFTLLFFY